jgi:hypothetical protein
MKKAGIRRREFLRVAVAGAATAPLALGAQPQVAISPNAVAEAEFGEPYDLLGKRLYFQNWHYIHPGAFEWDLPDGKRVGLEDAVAPDAALFKHQHQPYGIRLVAQPAERLGPLFEAERPWEEGAGVALTTVIKDGGKFRGWGAPFTTSGDPPGQKHFVHFESDDGLSWKRPNLGIVEFNGSRANNIVNIFGTDGGTVFLDPSAPSAERYKLIAEMDFPKDVIDDYLRRRPRDWDPKVERKSDGSAKGMCGAVSPDGIHWTQFRDPMVIEITDTQLTAYYDLQLRKYVAYTRTWAAGERSAKFLQSKRTWSSSRRSIGRSESDNFREFPLHDIMLEPGPELLPTDTLYTNGKTTMPGAPDHHLLFPTIWRTFGDTTIIGLASSRNGKNWHFLPGVTVFQTGPFGAFDGGCVFAHPNLLELSDGRFALPYTGYNVPHKYPRKLWNYAPGYMVWPKGRLIALEAPALGEFTTVAFMPPGRRLRINALTRRGGRLLVEVAGMNGDPIAGRTFADTKPLFGDLFWTPVVWNSQEDLGFKDGSPIRLRFRLDQVQIYGLEFA